MKSINIENPFNAPVYHEETVTSTMDISHRLVSENAPRYETKFPAHGTVIAADFQEAGRGRVCDRVWEMEREENLAFTILLRYPRIEKIPAALTLRAGLAVSLAVEDFTPSLKSFVLVKWPNDIMISGKKTAGILCEADGGFVHLGIGINIMQKEFPAHLKKKATSIYNELESPARRTQKEDSENPNIMLGEQFAVTGARFLLLEKILARLYDELEININTGWKYRLEERLYKKNERVTFIEGAVDSGKIVKGTLTGISESGELLILPEGEKEVRSFISGELKYGNL